MHPQNTSKVILTVAMAVYNASEFLSDAIENILTQSFQEFEFLILDDGSSDMSLSIINHYAKLDSRIKIRSKAKNEGLSAIRNQSIAEAQGKYLLMIDADDRFENDAFERFIDTAEKNSSDIVICNYNTFTNVKNINNKPCIIRNSKNTEHDSFLTIPAFTPIKLFRLNYLKKLGVRFPEGLTKQDIPLHWRIFTDKKKNVFFLNDVLFHYRQHIKSTSSRRDESVVSLIKVMDIVEQDLIKSGNYDEYKNLFLKARLSLMHGAYDYISDIHKGMILQLILERLDINALEYLNSKDNSLGRREKLFFKKIRGDKIGHFQYNCFLLLRRIYRKIKQI